MLKVEGKVLFKGKEERSSLGFKDAVEAYPFLSGLVTLLSLERPAWEDVGPLEGRPSYAVQILQAGLVRDLKGPMAASTSRVYEVGGESTVVKRVTLRLAIGAKHGCPQDLDRLH